MLWRPGTLPALASEGTGKLMSGQMFRYGRNLRTQLLHHVSQPNCTHVKTEAQRGKGIVQGHPVCPGQGRLELGFLTSRWMGRGERA